MIVIGFTSPEVSVMFAVVIRAERPAQTTRSE
jgi:hypothetical protein